jgi:hypothetical protein
MQGLPQDVQEAAEDSMRRLMYDSATPAGKAKGSIFIKTYYKWLRRNVERGRTAAIVEDLVAICNFCQQGW